MAERRGGRPQRIDAAVASFLADSGLGHRVEQASLIPEWPHLVGPQIAAVTEPYAITANGTLLVGVTTSAWMNELSLLEPQLLRSVNRDSEQPVIKRIRWQLRRMDDASTHR